MRNVETASRSQLVDSLVVAQRRVEALQAENTRLLGILRRIVDNEKRLEGQVAIHSSLRGKKEALAEACTVLEKEERQ